MPDVALGVVQEQQQVVLGEPGADFSQRLAPLGVELLRAVLHVAADQAPGFGRRLEVLVEILHLVQHELELLLTRMLGVRSDPDHLDERELLARLLRAPLDDLLLLLVRLPRGLLRRLQLKLVDLLHGVVVRSQSQALRLAALVEDSLVARLSRTAAVLRRLLRVALLRRLLRDAARPRRLLRAHLRDQLVAEPALAAPLLADNDDQRALVLQEIPRGLLLVHLALFAAPSHHRRAQQSDAVLLEPADFRPGLALARCLRLCDNRIALRVLGEQTRFFESRLELRLLEVLRELLLYLGRPFALFSVRERLAQLVLLLRAALVQDVLPELDNLVEDLDRLVEQLLVPLVDQDDFVPLRFRETRVVREENLNFRQLFVHVGGGGFREERLDGVDLLVHTEAELEHDHVDIAKAFLDVLLLKPIDRILHPLERFIGTVRVHDVELPDCHVPLLARVLEGLQLCRFELFRLVVVPAILVLLELVVLALNELRLSRLVEALKDAVSEPALADSALPEHSYDFLLLVAHLSPECACVLPSCVRVMFSVPFFSAPRTATYASPSSGHEVLYYIPPSEGYAAARACARYSMCAI